MSGPSRRTLERLLESVTDFAEPRTDLEQYLTPPDVASHILQLAALRGDLTDRTVLDLGTGTGLFAIGAAQYAPETVVGIDCDRAALSVARANERNCRRSRTPEQTPPTPIDWLCGDVTSHPFRPDLESTRAVTVVSNPPFGAQRGNRHADRSFLETARSIATVSYTIHNEGSQSFVESFARDAGATVTDAFQATFALEHRFAFHTAEQRTLETEVFRIEWASR